MPLTFPLFKQLDAMDCGATCLRMVAKWFGKTYVLGSFYARIILKMVL
ncbi:MAG: cysteine peptidase family C39 domain-containing protein [Chitinophagales bacterium]|nr:cysteine peptidase family C39 domain-containing protein [Sphingobacteriales bacterium]